MKRIAMAVIALLTGCASLPSSTPPPAEPSMTMAPQQQEPDPLNCTPSVNCAPSTISAQEKKNTDQKEKDAAICNYEATRATVSAPSGYSIQGTISNDMSPSFRELEFIQHCMKSKGHTKY